MRYDQMKDGSLDAYVIGTGTPVLYVPNSKGCTLASGTTYVFPFGHERSAITVETALASMHLKWDASVIVTFTIETCNFPATLSGNGQGAIDVASYDNAKGNWIQENPTTAYISVTSTDGTTGGATVTGATIVVAGGTAGGCLIHLGNLGARRCRIKAVVGGTGGVVRAYAHGKLGA